MGTHDQVRELQCKLPAWQLPQITQLCERYVGEPIIPSRTNPTPSNKLLRPSFIRLFPSRMHFGKTTQPKKTLKHRPAKLARIYVSSLGSLRWSTSRHLILYIRITKLNTTHKWCACMKPSRTTFISNLNLFQADRHNPNQTTRVAGGATILTSGKFLTTQPFLSANDLKSLGVIIALFQTTFSYI